MVGEYLSFASIKAPEFHSITLDARVLLITLIVFLGPRGIWAEVGFETQKTSEQQRLVLVLAEQIKNVSVPLLPADFRSHVPTENNNNKYISIYMFDSQKTTFLTRSSSGKIHQRRVPSLFWCSVTFVLEKMRLSFGEELSTLCLQSFHLSFILILWQNGTPRALLGYGGFTDRN